MGYTDELDVIGTLAALEMTLAELGYDVEPGRGRHRRAAGLDRPEEPRSRSADRDHGYETAKPSITASDSSRTSLSAHHGSLG